MNAGRAGISNHGVIGMALKYQLDSLDGLDDATKQLYTEKDGKYVLDVEDVPDPSGGEDVEGLKRKRDELQDETKKVKRERDELKQELDEKGREGARNNGDIEALERSYQEKLEAKDKELEQVTQRYQSAIQDMTVNSEAQRLANELAVDGESANVLIPHIKQRLSVEERDGEFRTVVLDEGGKPSANKPDELKGEFAENPAFKRVVAGSKASGGGADGGDQGGGAAQKQVDRSTFEGWSPQQQAQHVKEGGSVTDE